jgi:hypothetical protein
MGTTRLAMGVLGAETGEAEAGPDGGGEVMGE